MKSVLISSINLNVINDIVNDIILNEYNLLQINNQSNRIPVKFAQYSLIKVKEEILRKVKLLEVLE